MSNPYSYQSSSEGYYSFTTDYGIDYLIYFMDYSYMFGENGLMGCPVYTFNIETTSSTPNTPTDNRIEDTVVAIMESFFQNIENVVLYVCDNLDGKHRARARKFDSWFKRAKISYIEKYDFVAITEEYEVLHSVLIHANHAFKEFVIKECKRLNENDFMPL